MINITLRVFFHCCVFKLLCKLFLILSSMILLIRPSSLLAGLIIHKVSFVFFIVKKQFVFIFFSVKCLPVLSITFVMFSLFFVCLDVQHFPIYLHASPLKSNSLSVVINLLFYFSLLFILLRLIIITSRYESFSNGVSSLTGGGAISFVLILVKNDGFPLHLLDNLFTVVC